MMPRTRSRSTGHQRFEDAAAIHLGHTSAVQCESVKPEGISLEQVSGAKGFETDQPTRARSSNDLCVFQTDRQKVAQHERV
jgi:hypothetical protein